MKLLTDNGIDEPLECNGCGNEPKHVVEVDILRVDTQPICLCKECAAKIFLLFK